MPLHVMFFGYTKEQKLFRSVTHAKYIYTSTLTLSLLHFMMSLLKLLLDLKFIIIKFGFNGNFQNYVKMCKSKNAKIKVSVALLI
jgi:hypothetical protein